MVQQSSLSFGNGAEAPTPAQPLEVFYRYSDLHITAEFKGHRKYNFLETTVREEEDGKILVWAMLTRRDGKVRHYLNDACELAKLRQVCPEVDACYCQILYMKETIQDCPHVRIRFLTHDEDRVEADIYCESTPREKYGAPVSAEAETAETVVKPFSFWGATGIVSPRSTIFINGAEYSIGKRHWYSTRRINATYTEQHFALGLFPHSRVMTLRVEPANIAVGEEWLYMADNGDEYHYRVENVSEDLFWLSGTEMSLLASRDSETGDYAIHSISYPDEATGCTVQFTPPLPAPGNIREPMSSTFEIKFGEQIRSILGGVHVTLTDEKTVRYELAGKHIGLLVENLENGFRVQSLY